MAQLFTADRFTPVDGNGHVYAGAQLFFYQTGTTTLQTVYADSGATTPLSNPVVADGNGLFPAIYLSNQNAYKTVLQTSTGATIRTTDPISVASGTSATFTPQGRLTLASGTPVMTATQSGATSIIYTPYNGNQIPIYDGTSSFVATTFAELTNATTQSVTGNAGPAAVTTNSNYDLFVWSNAGIATLTRGPAWSSDTVRGTGAGTTQLQAVNGVQTNAVAITNGPGANRGTYVGTVRSNGTSTIDWIQGAVASGGTAAVLGVWNAYNRVTAMGFMGDSTSSWSYAISAVWRPANSSVGMRVSYVSGLQEDFVEAIYAVPENTATGTGYVGIGFNSISAVSGERGVASGNAGAFTPVIGTHRAQALGFNFMQALETTAGVIVNFIGNSGTPLSQSGMRYNARY